MMLACRNDFVDNKGCIQQASNMHGMYITMMKKLKVCVTDKHLLLKENFSLLAVLKDWACKQVHVWWLQCKWYADVLQ